jgi:hypothetical protein
MYNTYLVVDGLGLSAGGPWGPQGIGQEEDCAMPCSASPCRACTLYTYISQATGYMAHIGGRQLGTCLVGNVPGGLAFAPLVQGRLKVN